MIPSNKFLSNFGIIILLLCTLSCDNKTIDLPIADTTPPQAVLIYPVDGISVAGDITVLARATDNEEVDSVEFYINQKKVGRDNSGVNDIFDFVIPRMSIILYLSLLLMVRKMHMHLSQFALKQIIRIMNPQLHFY